MKWLWRWLHNFKDKWSYFPFSQKQMGEEEDHLFLVSQGLLDKDSRSRALNSKIISLQRFKAPYFSNYYKIGPRLNADQLNLANNPRYQVTYLR